MMNSSDKRRRRETKRYRFKRVSFAGGQYDSDKLVDVLSYYAVGGK